MNQKIPFHELSARIALATGIGAESAELFVKNFFDLLSEALTSGESVRIKGLGAFNVTEADGERSIEFLPDKEINDTINAPFAMFEAVSLSDDVSDEMLAEIENDVQIEAQAPATADETKVTPTYDQSVTIEQEVVNDSEETPADTTIGTDTEEENSTVAASEPETLTEQVIEDEPSEPTESSEPSQTASTESSELNQVTSEEATEIVEKESTDVVIATQAQPETPVAAVETEPVIEEIVEEEQQPAKEDDEPVVAESATVQSQTIPTPVQSFASQPTVQEEPVQPTVSKTAVEKVATPEPEVVQKETAETINHPTPPVRPVAELVEDEEEYVTPTAVKTNGGGNLWIGLIVGLIVGLALGACGVYLAIDKIFPTMHQSSVFNEEDSAEADELFDAIMSDSVSEEETVPTDTVAATPSESTPEVQPEPAQEDEPKQTDTAPATATTAATVTDTVRRGYLIHDMAKKHYGNKDFWVYIYEENKSKIGNPNNMQAGVVLVIPPAEKYGISANDPESLRKARAKAGEVLRKFSK